jgi:geranylgeranyl diphosphate synthase type II
MDILHEMLELRLQSAYCSASAEFENPCIRAANEHFAAGGNRVRAQICLEAGIGLGLNEADALCLASVCELLHDASLIQDDLMDRTPIRRGAPSIWAKYGDTMAICTGDLLLSAAYGLLSEVSATALIRQALNLVHKRTSEVIAGQVSESSATIECDDVVSLYERLAKGKSAPLLSLSLELPLLISGNSELLSMAYAAATDFAIVYQIADDLSDFAQDAQEGSLNLLLLLINREHMTGVQAHIRAIELAKARLASMEARARQLPDSCAAVLLGQGKKLRSTLANYMLAA